MRSRARPRRRSQSWESGILASVREGGLEGCDDGVNIEGLAGCVQGDLARPSAPTEAAPRPGRVKLRGASESFLARNPRLLG
jgi:hypothetical protein